MPPAFRPTLQPSRLLIGTLLGIACVIPTHGEALVYLSGKKTDTIAQTRITPIDQMGHLQIRIGKQRLKTHEAYFPQAEQLAADLNFDGWTDIWITGCTNGQCRQRASDIWLYNPASKRFEYSRALSSLGNLLLDPKKQILQSGIDNAGCAGMNFYYDTHVWQRGKLIQTGHREQSCEETGIVYREYAVKHGKRQLIRIDNGGEDDATQHQRRSGGYVFIAFPDTSAVHP